MSNKTINSSEHSMVSNNFSDIETNLSSSSSTSSSQNQKPSQNSSSSSGPKEPYGYCGKILWVDLTTNSLIDENVPDDIYRKYLGGYGLGVYYIYHRMPANCDPLGPKNILGFVPGLLTGTLAPFTGRYMVCGKSPLTGKGPRSDGKESTGGWGDSNSGGYFGPAIRRAGYDGIFITGISSKPVYLYIDNNGPQLLDANDLWGRDAIETDELLQKKHGKNVNIAAIGVAGEKKSLIAGIVNDKGRIAARSGLGAVMGSKMLKAICIKARRSINYYDKKLGSNAAKKYRERLNKNLKRFHAKYTLKIAPSLSKVLRWLHLGFFGDEAIYGQYFHEYGTSFSTALSAEIGDMPIKNHKGIGYLDWPQSIARQFAGTEMIKYKEKSYGCFGCPVRCGAILKIPELGLEETHRPEYETLGSFGGLILNHDRNTLFLINEFLNRQGMDSISAGTTIAFVLELVEQGYLKKEDFKCKEFPNGFLPQWNKSDYIMPLLRLMVNREGIGDILADGTWVASRKFGAQTIPFAMNINGQELPMHDARMMHGLALTYTADPTPGRHTAACLDFSAMGPHNHFLKEMKYANSSKAFEKGKKQAAFAAFKQAFNALGFCEFAVWNGRYPLWEILKSVFGWDITLSDLEVSGKRIQLLRQMFNAREGAIRHDIPSRTIGIPPLKKGPLRNITVQIRDMIAGYYEGMGFTEDGVPKEETLRSVGLDDIIDDLSRCFGAPLPEVPNEKNLNEKIIANKSIKLVNLSNQIELNDKKLKINLSGYFDGEAMNTEIFVDYDKNLTLKTVLEFLKKSLNKPVFNPNSIKNGKIHLMLNGTRINVNELSKKVEKNDIITILQPIIGG